MKKIFGILLLACFTVFSISAQNNKPNRIPKVGVDVNQHQYTLDDRGFWAAADILGGYSCNINSRNMGFAEFNAIGGYRFNQFFRIGAGIGGRYYINQKDNRSSNSKWAMPIFVAARGNFIPGLYRKIVPFYEVEIGSSIRDGFMFRPGIGLHIGEPRHACTLSVNYMGQNIQTRDKEGKNSNKFTSFFALRIGYEF